MSNQPEALRLADKLDVDAATLRISATELRRLHEVNQELVEALRNLANAVWRIHGEHGVIRGVRLDAEAVLAKATGESNE